MQADFSLQFFQNLEDFNILYIKSHLRIMSNYVLQKFLESPHPVKSYGTSKVKDTWISGYKLELGLHVSQYRNEAEN